MALMIASAFSLTAGGCAQASDASAQQADEGATVVEATDSTRANARRVVKLADAFMLSLTPDQRAAVVVDDSFAHLANWSNLPEFAKSPKRVGLSLDFALHDAGPATTWARGAQKGDQLSIAGPKGSRIVSPDVRRWLMIGDETALPAIGRKIEEAGAAVEITSLVAVGGAHEEQGFETQAVVRAMWVHRSQNAASDPAALLNALRDVHLKPETFVWIAAEASVVRAARDHLESHAQLKGWLKASGYWVAGQADAHDKLD